ncbi:MAG: C2H2-type zinc finger protein [Acidobacteriaceae bacterium]|nr:C2H2-type zinc finger protein [Acidobacteriaceae bacterium]
MKHTGLTDNEDGDRLFVCTFPSCGKRFKTKFSMTRHGLVHSQEKNYVCEFCGKKFALLQYLKEHTNTHTSAKPYICGVAGCQERFSQTGKLSLHRRTHPEYALKEYHSNASYNKKPGDLSEASQQESPHTEPEKHPPVKEKSERRAAGCESAKSAPANGKRLIARQDSGQTVTSPGPGGNEEWARAPFSLFAPPQEATTKEAAEEQNAGQSTEVDIDPLLRYLSYLQTPFSSAVRPVLPLPAGVRLHKSSSPFPHTALNLFELINKASN